MVYNRGMGEHMNTNIVVEMEGLAPSSKEVVESRQEPMELGVVSTSQPEDMEQFENKEIVTPVVPVEDRDKSAELEEDRATRD